MIFCRLVSDGFLEAIVEYANACLRMQKHQDSVCTMLTSDSGETTFFVPKAEPHSDARSISAGESESDCTKKIRRRVVTLWNTTGGVRESNKDSKHQVAK